MKPYPSHYNQNMTVETAQRRVPNLERTVRALLRQRKDIKRESGLVVLDSNMTRLDYNTSAIMDNLNSLRACKHRLNKKR
jgi:hypothetical protein